MKRELSDKYRIKLAVKTSESTYMDGMEIDIHVIDGKAKLEENYFEHTLDIMGSPKDDSIRWLSELGEIIYLQLEKAQSQTISLGY